MLCALCDAPLAAQHDRGLTDCAHEFCLACICRQLTEFRNLCPICGAKVKTVHQLQRDDAHDDTAAAPASVRFNNAVYILNVSIWAVDDPARVLAELFHLEQARLIHKGKLLKKGDVWPGTVVQLFGTRKGAGQQAASAGGALWKAYAPWNLLNAKLVQRVTTILCCPLTVLYDFFRSMFVQDDHGRRGYQRIDQTAAANGQAPPPPTFSEPGRVTSPHLIDLEN